MKARPGRGIDALSGGALPGEGRIIPPEDTPLLAAAALYGGRVPGLDRDRRLYWHAADEDMVRACMQALRARGHVESFNGKLKL